MRLTPFELPIFIDELGDEDLAREVAECLEREASRVPGRQASVVGGWHGPPDLVTRDEACWRRLVLDVARAVQRAVEDTAAAKGISLPALEYGMEGWGVVMGDGGYSVPHDHGDAHWSAVWYADVGDPAPDDAPDAGRLVLMAPYASSLSSPSVDLFPSQCAIAPSPTMVVVFPGRMTHFVHPYHGQRARVSVSFNVRLTPI